MWDTFWTWAKQEGAEVKRAPVAFFLAFALGVAAGWWIGRALSQERVAYLETRLAHPEPSRVEAPSVPSTVVPTTTSATLAAASPSPPPPAPRRTAISTATASAAPSVNAPGGIVNQNQSGGQAAGTINNYGFAQLLSPEVCNQIGLFVGEGNGLLKETRREASPHPGPKADAWSARVEAFLTMTFGPGSVGIFRNGSGLPLGATSLESREHRNIEGFLHVRLARLQQIGARCFQ